MIEDEGEDDLLGRPRFCASTVVDLLLALPAYSPGRGSDGQVSIQGKP